MKRTIGKRGLQAMVSCEDDTHKGVKQLVVLSSNIKSFLSETIARPLELSGLLYFVATAVEMIESVDQDELEEMTGKIFELLNDPKWSNGAKITSLILSMYTMYLSMLIEAPGALRIASGVAEAIKDRMSSVY